MKKTLIGVLLLFVGAYIEAKAQSDLVVNEYTGCTYRIAEIEVDDGCTPKILRPGTIILPGTNNAVIITGSSSPATVVRVTVQEVSSTAVNVGGCNPYSGCCSTSSSTGSANNCQPGGVTYVFTSATTSSDAVLDIVP